MKRILRIAAILSLVPALGNFVLIVDIQRELRRQRIEARETASKQAGNYKAVWDVLSGRAKLCTLEELK